jgi:peptidoglycan/xylan/chitin deacetylase (PgdA/CDA1 family)
MKRRRQRRLIPLILAILLVTFLIALATSLSRGDSASAGVTSSTSETGAESTVQEPVGDLISRARAADANEMGQVLVLMYHLIGYDDSQYNRTPEEFRQDIADLKAAGYCPVNLREFVNGDIDVPAGKSPVVITFDDSSGGQYRIGAGGQLDPDCAVAIMQAAVAEGGWESRASFYPLLDVDAPDHVLFGQPELQQQKLQQLVSWGYEIGSHTISHLNLQKASVADAKWQLSESQKMLETMIGGDYAVTTLAAPFGAYPAQASILKGGEYDGKTYSYQAALKATGGASLSPFSDSFRPYHIPRVQVSGTSLADALAVFAESPQLRYVSDGDPGSVAIPAHLDPALGSVRSGLAREVVRY